MSEQVKVERVRVSGLQDIQAPEARTFDVSQNGKTLVFEFFPLTSEQVEMVRASIPEPVPVEKPIPGMSGSDLSVRKQQGYPVTYKAIDDPEYQVAILKRDNEIAIEMVRVALRWGAMPWEFESDPGSTAFRAVRDDFRTQIKKSLTAGNLERLITEVTRSTFRLDPMLLDSFSAPSAPATTEVVDS